MRAVEDATATRRERFRWGTALFHEDFPLVWDFNFLRVDAAPRDTTAAQLAAEAELVQGAASLRHRKLTVEDEDFGTQLAPGFKAEGWSADRLLMMAHHRPPDRPSPDGTAREITLDAIKETREKSLRREESSGEEEIVQVRDMVGALVDSANARFFGAETGGTIGSVCELYSDGSTAQIEGVTTLEEHRGKGLARAVVLAALDDARSAGHDFVFLTADDDDWPKELYVKLGFDPIGILYDFKLTPDAVARRARDSDAVTGRG